MLVSLTSPPRAAAIVAASLLGAAAPAAHAQTFSTPDSINYVVPNGVTSATVVVNGAGGLLSNVFSNFEGGNGGSVTATLNNLVPGTTLTLFVGGNPSASANGSGGLSSGGEFSAIAFGANQTRTSLVAAGAANTPLLVLAGGGGSQSSNSGAGGAGGGTTGASGGGNLSGTGGTQTTGGTGATGFVNGTYGSFLLGGAGGSGAGGGGGGFYGGGGGGVGGSTAGAGGGGSSFSSATPSSFNGNIVVTLVSHTQGGGGAGQTNNRSSQFGSITITPNVVAAAAPEPGTVALVSMGLMGTAGMVIRRRKA